MKKTDCSVVKDLLPLYIDDVCGAESKVLVEEHLKQCKECTAEKAKMTGEIELPKDTGIKALMNIEITISKRVKRVVVLLGSLLLGVIITVVAGIILSTYQIPVDYEDLDGGFRTYSYVHAIAISSNMTEYSGLYMAEEYLGEDEDGADLFALYYGYTTTPLIELREAIGYFLPQSHYETREELIYVSGEYEGMSEDWKPLGRVTAIYYLPLDSHGEIPAELPADKSDAVLIWSEDESMAD
jgi:hypothetical protein